MQQSGGLLLAAGLDGGNTLIFVHSRTKMQIDSRTLLHKQERPFWGVLVYLCLKSESYSLHSRLKSPENRDIL